MVTDLIDLARNQSICDATVVAGDSDMRIAVQIAQSFGVRVHLVGMEPSRVSQSLSLRQEADTVHEISRAEVSQFLATLPSPVLAQQPSGDAPLSEKIVLTSVSVSPARLDAGTTAIKETMLEQVLQDAIERTLFSVDSESLLRLNSVLATSKQVPSEYDRRLLGTCRSLLGRDLTGDERREMRSVFILSVLARTSVEGAF